MTIFVGVLVAFLALEEIDAAIATPISASNPVIAVIIGQVTGIDITRFVGTNPLHEFNYSNTGW